MSFRKAPTRVSATIGGKEIILETGRVATQAHGSVTIQCGGTVVLVTVCSQPLDFDRGFFPLTVEYSERMYAAGRIPGSFFRREIGRPSERETLVSRLIDRPIRPLFPKGLPEDVQVLASVISSDQENESDVLSITAASAAVMLSPLPFAEAVAGGRIGRINGQFILNPTVKEMAESDLNIVFAASADALVMVEGEATFVPEDVIIDALEWGRKEIQPLVEAQVKLRELAGKAKMAFTPQEDDAALLARIEELAAGAGLEAAMRGPEKMARKDARKLVKEKKLNIAGLPQPVKMLNVTPSFYEQYKYHIWSVGAVLLVLLGGLFVSLYFYYHTKKLKDELEVSEGALREAKDRAEESSRLKSAFLANMSHEIRTPLNAIVGFSDVLSAGGASEEEQRGYFEIIRTNSDLLLRLINDILDVSRLEADRVILSLESCNVVQICRQVVASVAQARRSTNQFLIECEREEVEMRTDVQRLQQVVINLLSNADKFTKEGTITLKLEPDTAGNVAVFSVTDTGCGIPLDKQKRVFERFEKLNEYVQGTGLGLSICKLTVEKWGGEIWIDPAYTDGARFMFTHPMNL